MTLGALVLTVPWALVGVLAVPMVWWLARFTPPSARRLPFAPVFLLRALAPAAAPPNRTPWWLLLMRILALLAVICAMAGPIYAPGAEQNTGVPLVVVVDDGWSPYAQHQAKRRVLLEVLESANQQDRPVAMVRTTATPQGEEIDFVHPNTLFADARGLTAQPLAPNRAEWAEWFARLQAEATEVIWLADGIDHQGGGEAFLDALVRFAGSARVVRLEQESGWKLANLRTGRGEIKLTVQRVGGGDVAEDKVVALDPTGAELAEAEVLFAAGEQEAEVMMRLPPGVVPEQLALVSRRSAASVVLLDDRLRYRRVALMGNSRESPSPLLEGGYYLERALVGVADVVQLPEGELPAPEVSMVIMEETGKLPAEQRKGILAWVKKGGTLVRFAGDKLVRADEELLPARLRTDARLLGGALSWEEPRGFAPFPAQSPFYGLDPEPDSVRVRRQVLADPADTYETWARLTDGAPLITAKRLGSGVVVLFHVTANSDWSDLPFSVLFTKMLARILERSALGGGEVSGKKDAVLTPTVTMDGTGTLSAPPVTARPLTFAGLKDAPTLHHPPGYYSAGETRFAHNLAPALARPRALPAVSTNVATALPRSDTPLKWFFLTLAVLLFVMEGMLTLFPKLLRSPAVALALVAFCLPLGQAQAEPTPAWRNAHLAYITSHDAAVDEEVERGLTSLSAILHRRTSVQPGKPIEVNPATDTLALYPLLYWSFTPQSLLPTSTTIAKLNAYLKQGGLIVFDSRDGNVEGGGPGRAHMYRVLSLLDIRPLAPAPKDHTLNRSFYLLRSPGGVHDTGKVWVESNPDPAQDKVSAVIIGTHDWARGWAGGAGVSAHAREASLRFGVNLVMYTLTGNYKADQVHLPALIERLRARGRGR